MTRARRRFAALMLASLVSALALVGCGGDDDDKGFFDNLGTTPAEGNSADKADAESRPGGDAGATIPSGCPIEEDEVNEITGRQLPEDGEDSCRFSDGVASVLVTVQGVGLYDARRSETAKQYDKVEDAPQGDRGYIATDELRAEAYIESGDTSLTVILSSFELDQAGYKRTALALVDAVL